MKKEAASLSMSSVSELNIQKFPCVANIHQLKPVLSLHQKLQSCMLPTPLPPPSPPSAYTSFNITVEQMCHAEPKLNVQVYSKFIPVCNNTVRTYQKLFITIRLADRIQTTPLTH